MKKFKSTKTIYILPSIFIILFIAGIIISAIMLRKNIENLLWGISLPLLFLILTVIYLVRLINAPNTELAYDDENIYILDNPISLKSIKSIRRSTDIFINSKLIITTKDNEVYYIYHLAEVSLVEKELKRKLKIR